LTPSGARCDAGGSEGILNLPTRFTNLPASPVIADVDESTHPMALQASSNTRYVVAADKLANCASRVSMLKVRVTVNLAAKTVTE
jgi:hypothetical protein